MKLVVHRNGGRKNRVTAKHIISSDERRADGRGTMWTYCGYGGSWYPSSPEIEEFSNDRQLCPKCVMKAFEAKVIVVKVAEGGC